MVAFVPNGASEPCSSASRCTTTPPSIGGVEPERPTVEPGLGAAGEDDVGTAPGDGTELDRPAGQRPLAGVGPATVDAVRPDEVVQLVELEREPGPDLVGGPAFHLTGRSVELGLQLDDHPLLRAGCSRAIRSIAAPGERRTRLVDDEHRAVAPWCRDLAAGEHDEVAPERVRPGELLP